MQFNFKKDNDFWEILKEKLNFVIVKEVKAMK